MGFLRTLNGQTVTFAPDDAIYTIPAGINDRATIAGSYQDTAQAWHGFLRSADGGITVFDDPDANTNGNGTIATAINNNGAVTGFYEDKYTYTFRAFFRDQSGSFINFDTGTGIAPIAYPVAINLGDEIAGFSEAAYTYGFLRDTSGKVTDFETSDYATYVAGMNDDGAVVGSWEGSKETVAFVRDADGRSVSFIAPYPSYRTAAEAINKNGTVTGNWQDTNYVFHGFVQKK